LRVDGLPVDAELGFYVDEAEDRSAFWAEANLRSDAWRVANMVILKRRASLARAKDAEVEQLIGAIRTVLAHTGNAENPVTIDNEESESESDDGDVAIEPERPGTPVDNLIVDETGGLNMLKAITSPDWRQMTIDRQAAAQFPREQGHIVYPSRP
jgi:hypothetical protein